MQSIFVIKSKPLAHNLISSLVALLYGVILANLPNNYFKDRDNYIAYAKNVDVMLSRFDGIAFFFNEPLFGFYNKFLSNFVDPNLVPKLGVFFISATIAFFIMRYSKNWLAAVIGFILLFFVSFTFHLQLVVLRQGIATALLMWATHFFRQTWRFYFCAFLLSFFHISFIFVFFFLLLDRIVGEFFKNVKFRVFVIFCSMLLVSFTALKIASAIGVRQAASDNLINNQSGGGGFLLFTFMAAFLCIRGLNNVFRDSFGRVSFIGILTYLVFYYSIPISGRIIGTFLPFFYVYFVSEFRKKIVISATVFLIVNLFIFWGSVKSGSLTEEGIRFFGGFLTQ